MISSSKIVLMPQNCDRLLSQFFSILPGNFSGLFRAFENDEAAPYVESFVMPQKTVNFWT